MTALVGTDARFHCAGTGFVITWLVDGIPNYFPEITNRGVFDDTNVNAGFIHSNLTVPATSKNNGTSIQCGITSTNLSALGNTAYLTVLPGKSVNSTEKLLYLLVLLI